MSVVQCFRCRARAREHESLDLIASESTKDFHFLDHFGAFRDDFHTEAAAQCDDAPHQLTGSLVVDDAADEEQERYRDALVIGSGALDVLYRFRAADLLYRPHDALHVAAMWDPSLFSERGRINLHTLAITRPERRSHTRNAMY